MMAHEGVVSLIFHFFSAKLRHDLDDVIGFGISRNFHFDIIIRLVGSFSKMIIFMLLSSQGRPL